MLQSLEKEIADFSKDHTKHIKAAKDKLKAAKQQLEAARKQLKQAEQALQVAVAEQEAAAGERGKLQEQTSVAEQTIKGIRLACWRIITQQANVLLAFMDACDRSSSAGCITSVPVPCCVQLVQNRQQGLHSTVLMYAVMLCAGLEQEVTQLQAAVDGATESYNAAAKCLEAKRQRLKECDAEIRGLEKQKEQLLQQLQDCEVEKRRMDNRWAAVAGAAAEAVAAGMCECSSRQGSRCQQEHTDMKGASTVVGVHTLELLHDRMGNLPPYNTALQHSLLSLIISLLKHMFDFSCPLMLSVRVRLSAKRAEIGSSGDRLRRLEADYDWIAREKRNFGSGEFDFTTIDPRKAAAEYEDTGKRLEQLKEKGGVNRQVRVLGCRGDELWPCDSNHVAASVAVPSCHAVSMNTKYTGCGCMWLGMLLHEYDCVLGCAPQA